MWLPWEGLSEWLGAGEVHRGRGKWWGESEADGEGWGGAWWARLSPGPGAPGTMSWTLLTPALEAGPSEMHREGNGTCGEALETEGRELLRAVFSKSEQ